MALRLLNSNIPPPIYRLLLWYIGLWADYPRTVHGYGPNCLACEAVASPEQCLHVVRCEEKQLCYSHRLLHNGQGVYFKLGCMDNHVCDTFTILSQHSAAIGRRAGTNFLQCSECCLDNFCNQHTCTVTNSTSASGFINCMNCQQVADPARDCHSVRPCPPDHSCFVKRIDLHNHSADFHWDMGCWDEQQIQALNNTAVQDGCFKTCKTSFCNMRGCNDTKNYIAVQ